MSDVTVIHGDSLVELTKLASCSVDSIVTDPPYALGFMGKAWDTHTPKGFQTWCEAWASECLRVLKPGGHLLAFGGTRTYHRLASGIEDAGFEIRDSLHWLYGSGFPKSHDISKAIDKAAGAEWEIVGRKVPNLCQCGRHLPCRHCDDWQPTHVAPDTDAAKRWQGWGTALKPAHEPIVLARKPLSGTVASNVLQYGTGALNVDGCRVAGEVPVVPQSKFTSGVVNIRNDGRSGEMSEAHPAGRWPANVLLDDVAAEMLDEQSGTLASGGKFGTRGDNSNSSVSYADLAAGSQLVGYNDTGGASRFFPVFRYQAKATKKERPDVDGVKHPTVKPVALMQWLVRLVTPAGGIVLDPFAGSGATVEACIAEGLQCIAIEREADYLPLIEQRVSRQEDRAA